MNARGAVIFWRKFNKFVVKTPEGCWLWTGPQSGDGHGRMSIHNKPYLVHRLVWDRLKRPLPEAHKLRNTCGKRLCCNPDHWKLTLAARLMPPGNAVLRTPFETDQELVAKSKPVRYPGPARGRVRIIAHYPPTPFCAEKAEKLGVRINRVFEDWPYWQFEYSGQTHLAWSPEKLEAQLERLLQAEREREEHVKDELFNHDLDYPEDTYQIYE